MTSLQAHKLPIMICEQETFLFVLFTLPMACVRLKSAAAWKKEGGFEMESNLHYQQQHHHQN